MFRLVDTCGIYCKKGARNKWPQIAAQLFLLVKANPGEFPNITSYLNAVQPKKTCDKCKDVLNFPGNNCPQCGNDVDK